MRHAPLSFPLVSLAGIALVACMTGPWMSARAQSDAAPLRPQAARIAFDIAAQPLAAALEQYGRATGLPVFFDAERVAGRQAAPVHGLFDAQAALDALLAGTGLVADDAGVGTTTAFVLRLTPAVPAPARPADAVQAAPTTTHRGYDGLVQTRIWEALCAHPRAAPGGYRAAMRFVIDGTGRIAHAFLLHTSGERARDEAILDTLRQLRIDRAPPPDMAQPLTMLILPRSQTPGLECPVRH